MPRVTKEWPLDKVLLKDERARATGRSGPDLPLYQWSAMHDLEALKEQFEAGDHFALLLAIRKCANHDLVMPDWVARNFIRRCDQVLGCRQKSWDEAFGQPYPKGTHIASLRRNRELRLAVWLRIREIIRTESVAIDDGLFHRVGKEFGISKTIANKLYYEAKRLCALPAGNF
jgi:hypothetical protein